MGFDIITFLCGASGEAISFVDGKIRKLKAMETLLAKINAITLSLDEVSSCWLLESDQATMIYNLALHDCTTHQYAEEKDLLLGSRPDKIPLSDIEPIVSSLIELCRLYQREEILKDDHKVLDSLEAARIEGLRIDSHREHTEIKALLAKNCDAAKINGLPKCYVRHNGLIEYLPTLLEVTPLAYTFVIPSETNSGIATVMNSFSPLVHNWFEYDSESFLESEGQVSSRPLAIIVNVPIVLVSQIEEVFIHRTKFYRYASLLINVYGQNAEKILLDLSVYLNAHSFEILVIEESSHSIVLPPMEKVLQEKADICWRILLSHELYFHAAIKKASETVAKYLLAQSMEHLLNKSDEECVGALLANPMCGERFSRDSFKTTSIKQIIGGQIR